VLYPAMLIAPLVYRGRLWQVVLASTSLVFVVASGYYESTYGESKLENLVACTRQILPVLPLYLLAYCGIISSFIRRPAVHRYVVPIACGALAISCILISFVHQRKLQELTGTREAIVAALPADSVVYGNKDVIKLHQPMWDHMVYRDLLTLNMNVVSSDLRKRPCFVVLYMRSRNVANEDSQNREVLAVTASKFMLIAGPHSSNSSLRFYRVIGLRPAESRSAKL